MENVERCKKDIGGIKRNRQIYRNIWRDRGGVTIMYISEFWCGVLATIGVEFVALIGYAIQQTIKQNKEGK